GAGLRRRMPHTGSAAPCLPDSAADVPAVGEKGIHAGRGRDVPGAQVTGDGSYQCPRDPTMTEVVLIRGIEIPEITHRSVAVADMAGARGCDDALGRSGFAAD